MPMLASPLAETETAPYEGVGKAGQNVSSEKPMTIQKQIGEDLMGDAVMDGSGESYGTLAPPSEDHLLENETQSKKLQDSHDHMELEKDNQRLLEAEEKLREDQRIEKEERARREEERLKKEWEFKIEDRAERDEKEKHIKREEERLKKDWELKPQEEKEKREKQEKELEEEMRKRLADFGFQDNQIQAMIKNEDDAKLQQGLMRSNSMRLAVNRKYVKVPKEHLEVETLLYYDLPYETDSVSIRSIML